MTFLNFFIQDFHSIIHENYIVKTYTGESSIDSSYTSILEDSIPKGYEGILAELALDNTTSADVTLFINNKEQGNYGFPLKASAFPANMEGLPVLIPIPEHQKFVLKARNLSGSTTLKWRATVVLVKK